MVVAPLVLGLLICAAADVKDFKTLGKIGGKTIAIFLGSTAIAVAIGLVASNLFQIGAGFTIPSEVSYDAKDVPSVVDTLMNIIPTNPFNALSTQNLLQIIFFSLLLGFALIALGEKGAPVLNFFRAWTDAWKEITNIVLKFTPYGVFGLMADIVGKYGLDVMLPFVKTIAACYVTCFLFTLSGRSDVRHLRRYQSQEVLLHHEGGHALRLRYLLQRGYHSSEPEVHQEAGCLR